MLYELEKNAGKDEGTLDIQAARFKVEENGEVVGEFLKEGHKRTKPVNRKYIEEVIEGLKI